MECRLSEHDYKISRSFASGQDLSPSYPGRHPTLDLAVAPGGRRTPRDRGVRPKSRSTTVGSEPLWILLIHKTRLSPVEPRWCRVVGQTASVGRFFVAVMKLVQP